MGALRKIALSLMGTLAMAACTPSEPPQQAEAPAGQSYARDMSDADKATCTSAGGTVERRGRLGAELCVHPFADAGKVCSDSAQCEGKCITSSDAQVGNTAASGQCQADDRLFGCFAEVRNGKPVNAICID